MQHSAPRQHQGTGLWHYTTGKAKSGFYAIGLCSPYDTCPDCKGHSFMSASIKCETCDNKGSVKREEPCPGHATAEEACEHYKEYLVSKAQYEDDKGEHEERTLSRCEFKKGTDEQCRSLTSGAAYVESRHYCLCAEHRNPESLAEVVQVGESWHS